MSIFHTPVLLQEIIEFLNIQKGQKYIDATTGGGGHTIEILKRGGLVLGIDQDQEALDFSRNWLYPEYEKKLILVKANFANIEKIAKVNGFKDVCGILFDLGVSSYQIGNPKRGFSFKNDSLLDMRMDSEVKKSALEIVNSESFETLEFIFRKYGEESFSKQVALAIVKSRSKKEIRTTKELVEIVEMVINARGKINPATKIFQALRIAVNDELNALTDGLNGSIKILNTGGRIAVISYHSLEDRITKLKFKNKMLTILTKKPITASYLETRKNPRARSAKLRVCEKL